MTEHDGSALLRNPQISAVGIQLLSDALRDQGVSVTDATWQPPSEGMASYLSQIAADQRRLDANQQAVQAMIEARPEVVGVSTARDALGLERRQFLHSGPPISWENASGPLRGALVGALLLEGEADNADEAWRICEANEIDLLPCHSRGAVGPMAGVISASMSVYEIRDEVNRRVAYSNLNEGLGKVLRMGAYSSEVIDRLRWINSRLAPILSEAFAENGPFDIRALLAQSLQMGDEGHNRNRAGSAIFLREMAPSIAKCDVSNTELSEAFSFINGNEHFVLNMVMPAAKAAADAARNIAGSTMVVAMARNGTEFGIQVSGAGDKWFTAPANTPEGILFSGFSNEDINPDIGDSTIMETYGIGGFAMACAPAIVRFVGGSVELAHRKTHQMYEITLAENPHLQIASLDFRGTPTGIDVAKVVSTQILPAVNTGMAGKEAGTGQVGAGLVEPPMSCFEEALMAVAGSGEVA